MKLASLVASAALVSGCYFGSSPAAHASARRASVAAIIAGATAMVLGGLAVREINSDPNANGDEGGAFTAGAVIGGLGLLAIGFGGLLINSSDGSASSRSP